MLPDNGSRPADEGRAATSRRLAGGALTPSLADHGDNQRPRRLAPGAEQVARRRRWAYGLIRRTGQPPPSYGTREWLALPEGDPAKVAAVVTAAECWAQAGDELELELRREVADLRRGHKRAEDAEYAARAAEHRQRWPVPTWPTFVQRRKAQLDDCQPRPGDRPGRSDGGAA